MCAAISKISLNTKPLGPALKCKLLNTKNPLHVIVHKFGSCLLFVASRNKMFNFQTRTLIMALQVKILYKLNLNSSIPR